MMASLRVTLNGTSRNPWLRFGLRQNPFPQLGRAEYDGAESALASLDGDPLQGPEDIRARLAGLDFDPEFVEGLCERFVPGCRKTVTVTFPM